MKNQTSKAHFGWCMYDWANSAFATVILAAVLPVYFVSLVPADGARLFFAPGHAFAATSLWGYSVAISMLLIALIAPALGALADRRGWHKGLLLAFCTAGCCATALLALPGDNNYLLAAGLFILANFSFAGSNIFYNAYLPHLVALEHADRLSARGYAYGYIGGGLMLALAFGLILKHDLFGFANAAAATRFGFLLTALWWFAFALPTFIYLPSHRKVQPTSKGLYFKKLFGPFSEASTLSGPLSFSLCVSLLQRWNSDANQRLGGLRPGRVAIGTGDHHRLLPDDPVHGHARSHPVRSVE